MPANSPKNTCCECRNKFPSENIERLFGEERERNVKKVAEGVGSITNTHMYPAILAQLPACGLALLLTVPAFAADGTNPFFGIHVVDEQTGRGVPLVELETVSRVRCVTDSGGWIAFHEPGLMGQKVFFHVRSHGYEFAKDGFGYAGVALTPVAGERATLRLKRRNIAERLYRVTGQGIYRDSVLLGENTPLAEPLGSGKVAGQDSAFAVRYADKLFWFWGDTSRMSYPLGHFWMAGAVSDLPGQGGLDPGLGVNLRYFTDKDGFSRPVCRLGVERGLIWADAFAAVPDEPGRERLVCHYAHMESLEKMLGHGLAVYNDRREEFERITALDMDTLWCFPGQAHVVRHREGGTEYLYLGEVFPTVRVPASFSSFTNLNRYEAWTCLAPDSTATHLRVQRTPEGRPDWRWTREAKPADADAEQKLIAAGQIKPEEARFNPADVDSGARIRLHRGSVNWNTHRKRWIMIATQQGGTSNLGEVWYAEAAEPTGPWRVAKKIVTHDQYTFYNPVHHPFFDQDGGRRIYFEGTYANTFSGNADATPRYDYNQVMYRLDLDDPRLKAAQQ